MPIYKFNAEHISRNQSVKLVHKLEDLNFEVEYADMNPVFQDEIIMIVTCTKEQSMQVRDYIWEVNTGLYCDVSEIPADHLASYLYHNS